VKRTIIIDFGGPETPEEVFSYLDRLFSDPEILPIPAVPLRRAVARLIALTRCRHSKGLYAKIGGASPLNSTVRNIAKKAGALFAFKYSGPDLDKVISDLRGAELTVLPLFPFYAHSTVRGIESLFERNRGLFADLRVVRGFADHPAYLDLVVQHIRPYLEEESALLCTAHAIPQSHVRKGDPYCAKVGGFAEKLGEAFGGQRTFLAYQSRTGPVRWSGPDVESVLPEVLNAGYKRLAVFPLSFVCDNLETLYDLDIALKARSRALGFTGFRRAPCFNDDAGFVEFLRKLL
jgi:ferrochelatase